MSTAIGPQRSALHAQRSNFARGATKRDKNRAALLASGIGCART
jgi:hypothetical protein